MLDTSCIVGKPELSTIQDNVFAAWNATDSSITTQDLIASMKCPTVLGQHFFITTPDNPKLQPVWDFRPSSGDPNAFVVAAEFADLPAPTGHDDVDWLQLKGVQGGLADSVFRLNTKSGQPPPSVSLV